MGIENSVLGKNAFLKMQRDPRKQLLASQEDEREGGQGNKAVVSFSSTSYQDEKPG